MNIKNSVLDYRLHKKQTVYLIWSRAKNERRKATSKNIVILSTWKKKKEKEDLEIRGCRK